MIRKNISKSINKKMKETRHMDNILKHMSDDRKSVKTELNNQRLEKQLNGYKQDRKEINKRIEKQRELQKQRPMFYQGNGNGK